jgi:hypothetical protein
VSLESRSELQLLIRRKPMRFLTNIHDPEDPKAKMYLALSFEDFMDPQGHERAWQRHLDWLKDKVIGEPKGTDAYTSEQLKEMGMVGVYAIDKTPSQPE